MNSTIEKYRNIRTVGMELNGEFLKCLHPNDMRIAMRALGVLKGDKIVLSSDADMDRCYDFVVHNFRNSAGSNLIDIYAEKNSDLSGVEKEIIEASLASKSSLFKIVDIDPHAQTLELADLIGTGDNINVLDIGFSSNSASKYLLMYSRIISFDDFKMTSGAPLLFHPEYKETLLDKYKQKMKKVVVGDEQTKMSAAFFQLYQRYGIQSMGYA